MASDQPCVFIYGPEHVVVKDIINELSCHAESSPQSAAHELVVCYPWHVDNKYYTAEVQLCHVLRKGLPDQLLADRCQAVVIWLDTDQANGLDEVDSILAFTKEFEPDVCLLVCQTCHDDTPVSRVRAQQWCISRGFELVELAPSEEADPDDDFQETTGLQRIRQALHAHTWSNLQLKDHRPPISNKLVEELNEERTAVAAAPATSTANGCPEVESTPAAPAPPDPDATRGTAVGEGSPTDAAVGSLVAEMAALASDSCQPDDFETLFSQLAELRAAACHAPPEQRLQHAERAALAMLRALGDEDEPHGEDG